MLGQVKRLLGHAHVSLKPVIDLTSAASVNAYEFPESMKERIHLGALAKSSPTRAG